MSHHRCSGLSKKISGPRSIIFSAQVSAAGLDALAQLNVPTLRTGVDFVGGHFLLTGYTQMQHLLGGVTPMILLPDAPLGNLFAVRILLPVEACLPQGMDTEFWEWAPSQWENKDEDIEKCRQGFAPDTAADKDFKALAVPMFLDWFAICGQRSAIEFLRPDQSIAMPRYSPRPESKTKSVPLNAARLRLGEFCFV